MGGSRRVMWLKLVEAGKGWWCGAVCLGTRQNTATYQASVDKVQNWNPSTRTWSQLRQSASRILHRTRNLDDIIS